MTERRDHGPLGRSVARLHAPSGRVVGAGFLVAPDLVATCAHVVTAALGGDPESDRVPTGTARVSFPLAGPGFEPVPARVRTWRPIRQDGSGDIALLRLTDPVPAAVPPLRRVENPWGHEFRVLGFPPRMTDGVWASGEIRDRQGTGWVQLTGTPGGQPVEGGFSGAPVWDAQARAVIGMTVAADADRGVSTAYVIPVEQVLGGDPGLLPNPYRGLAPFDEEHAEFFHGRAEDVDRLADAVARRPVVAVLGDSGAGKSSLVRAGLVPRLRQAGTRVAVLRPMPGVPSRFALAIALAGLTDPNARGPARLRLAESIMARLDRGWQVGEPALLFLDQFEELIAEDLPAARDLLGLLVRLTRGTRPALRVVLTLRWAAAGDLLSEDTADVLDGAVVSLAPMGRTQLRAAITAPAERAPGLYFESGLVDRILDDAGAEPGQLPLVESLLAQLWEQQDGGYVTHAAYEWLGGVHGAVARGAERALAGFAGPGEPALLRQLFTMLVRADEDGYARRAVPVAQLSPGLARLAQRLSADRLVVIGAGADGAAVVELAHQALIDHWPRLRDWLAADLDFLRWRARLDQQLAHAATSRRPGDLLLRGTELAEGRRWLAERGAELSPAQTAFVRNSGRRRGRRVLAAGLAAAAAITVTAVTTVLVVDRTAETPVVEAGATDSSTAPPPTTTTKTVTPPTITTTTTARPAPSAGATLPGPTTTTTTTTAAEAPVPFPTNCQPKKICFYPEPDYRGTPTALEIDYTLTSKCQPLGFVARSVFNNYNQNQKVYSNTTCAGNVFDVVELGSGEPNVTAYSYRHT